MEAKGRQFGDYVLGRQLGSGGMGIVYEAQQLSLNRKVALKFLRDSQVASPTLLRRFTIEAEAAARLHHPNIVAIFEIGEVEGQPYFSMDLVEGDSLRGRIAKGEFLSQNLDGSQSGGRSQQIAAARLIAKTARALHHAHQRGVLHRDLKPANILLDELAEPHLTDFGLAKILRVTTDLDTRQSLTGTGDIAGTPSYMSPEQASGGTITVASDIYGLGAVLYELLTGQPPYRGDSVVEILRQVLEEPVRKPRSINRLLEKDLEIICLKCLDKDPRHRYSSAEALAEDLENWMAHKPIKARPVGVLLRGQRWIKRNPAGTALIVVLFLGLSAALVLLNVVNEQKTKSDIQQALLFREKVDQLSKHWADEDNGRLVVSARELAILGNRPPPDPTARTLSIGESILGDPVSFAQQRAPILAELEAKIGKQLGEPVQLDLVLSKSHIPERDLLVDGLADIIISDPTSYLEARKKAPGLVPLARISGKETIVVVARAESELKELSQLKGRTVAFGDSQDPVTVWFKARLLDAGLVRTDLRPVSSPSLKLSPPEQKPIEPRTLARSHPRGSSRESVAAVLKGSADAAAVHLRRFELEKHNGLVGIDTFSSTPRIVVARQGLEAHVAEAFRAALIHVRTTDRRPGDPDDNTGWEETLDRAVPIDDSYLRPLLDAMRKAARFDGKPDPFPED